MKYSLRNILISIASGIGLGICCTGILSRFSSPAGLPGDYRSCFLIFLAAPIAEELFFRAVLIGCGQRWLHRIPSLLLSSLIFAVLHMHYPETLFAFFGGLLFGLLFLKNNSVVFPILSHVSANLASALPASLFSPVAITISMAFLLFLYYRLFISVAKI